MTKRVTVWPQKADIQDRVNAKSADVVDVADGSSGTLATPDNYRRTDSPSDGIEQLIFAPRGPLADVAARRALASCTPRDVIARDAADADRQRAAAHRGRRRHRTGRKRPRGRPVHQIEPRRGARGALGGKPLTVRIGYRAPNARLAAIVGAIAKACAPAGITVSDVTSDSVGPQTLQGREDRRAAGQHRRRHRQRFDRVVGDGRLRPAYRQRQQPVRLHQRSDRWHHQRAGGVGRPRRAGPAAGSRARRCCGPDMPTLPLYRQQRTLLASKKMYAVSANPSRWGAGWNMDRWVLVR